MNSTTDHHGNEWMRDAYIINVLIVIANVIKLDLIIVSWSEGVCLVDFGCEKEENTVYVHF